MKHFVSKDKASNRWEGEGINEVGKEKDTGVVRIKINPKYFRPTEVVCITK